MNVLLRHALLSLLNKDIHLGWNSWKSFACERAVRVRRLKQGLLEWLSAGSRKAWLKWRGLTMVWHTLAVAIHGMQHQQKRVVLNTWKDQMQTRFPAERRVASVLHGLNLQGQGNV